LAYVRPRNEQYGMVDAIFASTTGGLMALAPAHNPNGDVSDFRIVAINQGGADLLLRDAAAVQWQLLSVLFPQLRETGAIDRLVELHRKGGAVQFDFTYPGQQGLLYFSIRATAMNGLVSASLFDVSDIKQREESFKLLFQGSPLPMFVYDRNTLAMRDINDAAAAHYGYSREDFLALNLLDIRPEEDRQRIKDIFASGDIPSDTGETWRHLKANGEIIEVKVYSREVVHHGTPSRLAVVVDVTEQRKTEARINFMAHHDALTGLPNRVMFLEELRRTLSRVRRQEQTAAVICIDLDFFKDVNDTLGHPAGDQLLRQVSQRLCNSLRDNDLVARLGGDEFCIIQRDLVEPGEAGKLAERLIATLSKPYDIDGQQVVIGASMGIALAPNDGETAEDVLKNADMALYRSKDDGRGLFRYFQSEMDARMRARRALEVELRRALVAGEFELNYQPFVSTTTNAVTGFEALLRWRNPVRGMVPPADFIPLAEEIGLITPIGEWVLRQACAEAANWPSNIRVAVNLSAVQFKGNKLAAVVASALAASGLPAERLELEITESVLLRNSEANLTTLHQLRALGVRISMDDFGTGYSSLSYLRSFPFDKIKIDQSFIREMGDNSGDAAIVSAVTGLGTSLGISTTAEGVETADQLERLKNEGCTEVQGYFLGRPMPAQDVHRLLDEQANVA
jgi:diguanylate cyclase (GGDEF)-like protein/PAS domain S-box-containing protein